MMAELVDAHDSKSCEAIHVGSSPTRGTIKNNKIHFKMCIFFLDNRGKHEN